MNTNTTNTYSLTAACNFVGNQLPAWIYELNNCFHSGTLDTGIDYQIALLYGVAHAAKALPKGSSLSIVVSDYKLAKLGNRLFTADRDLLPFLPITPAHRAAWECVLRLLAEISVTWSAPTSPYPPLFDTLHKNATRAAEVAA